MGCDIHMAVEVRRGGVWERALPPVESRDPQMVEWAAGDDAGTYYAKQAETVWYWRRSYNLFAVLANVRNGYGFAGTPTGNEVIPISEPRGLPDDMSAGVRRLLEDTPDHDEDDIWLGDHSHSWLTLDEVLAYDWDQAKMTTGVVSAKDFAARIEKYGNQIPARGAAYSSWCGGTSGPGISTISAREAIGLLNNGGIAERPGWGVPGRREVFVQDSWITPLRDRIDADWFERVIPALIALDPDPMNVRLVFGFDS